MSRRIRSIKPELLEDEKTANLSDTAFRLFIGLITMADDFGTFRADARFVEKQVYWLAVPERGVAVAMLELEGLVTYYTVRGQKYGRFNKWKDHQRVDNAGKRGGSLPGPEQADGLAATRGGSPALAAGSGSGLDLEGRGSDARAKIQPPEPEEVTNVRRISSRPPSAPSEAAGSERRLKSAPPPPAEPPELLRIRDAILAEPKLADLDAADLANEALTLMLAKGLALDWILQAVREAAAKSQRSELSHVRHGRLVGFFRRSRPRRDESEPKPPPAQREHDDAATIERLRRMPKRVTAQDQASPAPMSLEKLAAGIGKGGT